MSLVTCSAATGHARLQFLMLCNYTVLSEHRKKNVLAGTKYPPKPTVSDPSFGVLLPIFKRVGGRKRLQAPENEDLLKLRRGPFLCVRSWMRWDLVLEFVISIDYEWVAYLNSLWQ